MAINTEATLERAIEIFDRFNQAECPAVSVEAQEAMERAFSQTGFLEFGTFACPPINARLLTSDSPESYILTTPTGSSFEKGGKDQRIAKMFKALREIGIEARLRVIIGDTDEEDYVFPVVPAPQPLDPQRVEVQRQDFFRNFSEYLGNRFAWPTQVERYSDIASLFDDQLPPPDLSEPNTQEDLMTEERQMTGVFRPGEYYDGYAIPSLAEIKAMTRLKFLTYASQGTRLAQMYPEMVLIQNEFPLLLRTRMLNNLNRQQRLPHLPIVYPIPDRSRR